MTGSKIFETLVKLNERMQHENGVDSSTDVQEYSGIQTRFPAEITKQLDFVYSALLPAWNTELTEVTLAAALSMWYSYDRKICKLIRELLLENDNDKMNDLLGYYGLEDYEFDLVNTPSENKLLSITISFSNPETARYDLFPSKKQVRQMKLLVRKIKDVFGERSEL